MNADDKTLTDEQAGEQVKHENEVQTRARDIVDRLTNRSDRVCAGDVATLCEAIRIYARDDESSMALAQQAIDILEMAKRCDGRILKCGWCVLVHGNALAEQFPDDATCQAHVHGCEHNPLVMRCKALEAALREACEQWQAWMTAEGRGPAPQRERLAELRKVAGEP